MVLLALIFESKEQAGVATSVHLQEAFQDCSRSLELILHIVCPWTIWHQQNAVREAEEGQDNADYLIEIVIALKDLERVWYHEDGDSIDQ